MSHWRLERDSFDALEKGLEKTYRRGRREFEAAMEEPTVESLHEWRKRVKHLWYHHTLLRSLWPPVMEVTGDEAHALSDRLGDDHDLAVLAAWVEEHGGAGPDFRRCGRPPPERAAGRGVQARRARVRGEAEGVHEAAEGPLGGRRAQS